MVLGPSSIQTIASSIGRTIIIILQDSSNSYYTNVI